MIGELAPRTPPHLGVASRVAACQTGSLVVSLASEYLMGAMASPLRSCLSVCVLSLALSPQSRLAAIHCQPLSPNRTPRGAPPARDTPD